MSGPYVPGGDGLLVALGHVQLSGRFGREQADLLVLMTENRGAVGGQYGAAVGDDQYSPTGDGLVDPGPARDERARLDLPPGLFEYFPFESLLWAVVSAHFGCRVADLQPPAGQLPLLTLVLQQQHAAVVVDGDAFDGDGPGGRSIGHEGPDPLAGILGFLNVARAAYHLSWLSESAGSTICRFTSGVCRLTVDALPICAASRVDDTLVEAMGSYPLVQAPGVLTHSRGHLYLITGSVYRKGLTEFWVITNAAR